MNSTTLLGLAGIGGTLLAAVIGTSGNLGQTSMARRAATAAENQRARRTVYVACATVLMARRDAVTALRELFLDDELDQDAARRLVDEIASLRADVARTVAGVMVEGPAVVGWRAELAARGVEIPAGRYRDWTADVVGGRDLGELLMSQMRFANEDQGDMEIGVSTFLEECRKALHPGDPVAMPRRGWRYRWRQLRSR